MRVCVQPHESYSRAQDDDVEDFNQPKLIFGVYKKVICINENIYKKKKPQLIETLQKYAERAVRCPKRQPEFHSGRQLDI